MEYLRSKRVRDIACGSAHSACITSNGELYTWGLGEYGRLGHGDNLTQLRPKQVKALAGGCTSAAVVFVYISDNTQAKLRVYRKHLCKTATFFAVY